jgi:DNA-binding CsgD family transcriptional regulator
LTLSVHTVHTHISKIFKKLGAKNRSEALVKARRIGIALADFICG